MTLVRGIDGDPVRRALVRAVAEFARGIDAWLVAEGIETPAERDTLLDLGISLGQGYLLGRPGPWDPALTGVSAPG
jgi:EAL domain-containing protein (putative c-di-GMP-specific phosphodiesterase class I)